MAEKTQKQILQEMQPVLNTLHTVILGVPGTEEKGLVGDVKEIKDSVAGLSKSHGKLKRNFYILVGMLIGSGVITGGVFGALSAQG